MHRFLILSISFSLYYIIKYFSPGHLGVSSTCTGNVCFVSASTSLLSILLGGILFIFIVKFPRPIRNDTQIMAGFWRRFAAFIIDFLAVMLALTPIVTVPTVALEYFQTGEFFWAFQRDFSRTADNFVIVPSVFILLGGLVFYFYKYAEKSKPTLGQYVLGYRIIANEGEMTKYIAKKRILLSLVGLTLWPIAIIHGLFKKKVFWWDSGSKSSAIVTVPVNDQVIHVTENP